ncbi:hypothetical protein [Edaphobacter modestus]|uniref:hypothetical protein n=1 Tax=Edaphobacter modestus TaxID=388466 RepID=UPI00102C1226|nr:hypothetical protein [Edaphobacter modestus]
MRQIFGAINQYEKAMIVAKLKGARQRMRAKEGRCEGRKAYGFRAGEQTVIERIKTLRKEGLPLQAISDTLNRGDSPNREGVKTRTAAMIEAAITRVDANRSVIRFCSAMALVR